MTKPIVTLKAAPSGQWIVCLFERGQCRQTGELSMREAESVKRAVSASPVAMGGFEVQS